MWPGGHERDLLWFGVTRRRRDGRGRQKRPECFSTSTRRAFALWGSRIGLRWLTCGGSPSTSSREAAIGMPKAATCRVTACSHRSSDRMSTLGSLALDWNRSPAGTQARPDHRRGPPPQTPRTPPRRPPAAVRCGRRPRPPTAGPASPAPCSPDFLLMLDDQPTITRAAARIVGRSRAPPRRGIPSVGFWR